MNENQMFLAYLRAWGLDKPLGILWEALPYSWLIDYVFNIGDMIAAFEYTASPFPMVMVDSGYSTKDEVTYLSSGSVSGLFNYTPHTVEEGTSIYQRHVYKPEVFPTVINTDGISWVRQESLSSSQWSYVAALAIQRAYR
jgi:hypothetical protein